MGFLGDIVDPGTGRPNLIALFDEDLRKSFAMERKAEIARLKAGRRNINADTRGRRIENRNARDQRQAFPGGADALASLQAPNDADRQGKLRSVFDAARGLFPEIGRNALSDFGDQATARLRGQIDKQQTILQGGITNRINQRQAFRRRRQAKLENRLDTRAQAKQQTGIQATDKANEKLRRRRVRLEGRLTEREIGARGSEARATVRARGNEAVRAIEERKGSRLTTDAAKAGLDSKRERLKFRLSTRRDVAQATRKIGFEDVAQENRKDLVRLRSKASKSVKNFTDKLANARDDKKEGLAEKLANAKHNLNVVRDAAKHEQALGRDAGKAGAADNRLVAQHEFRLAEIAARAVETRRTRNAPKPPTASERTDIRKTLLRNLASTFGDGRLENFEGSDVVDLASAGLKAEDLDAYNETSNLALGLVDQGVEAPVAIATAQDHLHQITEGPRFRLPSVTTDVEVNKSIFIPGVSIVDKPTPGTKAALLGAFRARTNGYIAMFKTPATQDMGFALNTKEGRGEFTQEMIKGLEDAGVDVFITSEGTGPSLLPTAGYERSGLGKQFLERLNAAFDDRFAVIAGLE